MTTVVVARKSQYSRYVCLLLREVSDEGQLVHLSLIGLDQQNDPNDECAMKMSSKALGAEKHKQQRFATQPRRGEINRNET